MHRMPYLPKPFDPRELLARLRIQSEVVRLVGERDDATRQLTSELAELEPSRPIGADNDAIFGGELGLSPAELAELRADQVI